MASIVEAATSLADVTAQRGALNWSLLGSKAGAAMGSRALFESRKAAGGWAKPDGDAPRLGERRGPPLGHFAVREKTKVVANVNASASLGITTGAAAAAGASAALGNPGILSLRYNLTSKLGSGTHGTVFGGCDRVSGDRVAVKEIRSRRSGVGSSAARAEAMIMGELEDCPNVVGFQAFFEDDPPPPAQAKEKRSYIVMDMCGGGGLDEFLEVNEQVSEGQAVAIISEVVRVLQAFHSKKILHADVKASNFVIDTQVSRDLLVSNPSKLKPGWLKAIDFGTCRHIGISHCSQVLGTPTYWAPEMFGRKAFTPSDMWSLGVLTFQLLTGRHPFWSKEEEKQMKSTRDLLAAVMSRLPEYNSPQLKNCSQEALDFLQNLLVKDGAQRMSAEQAGNHPWLAGVM